MISLKKHIELHSGQLVESTLNAYREALDAMGACGVEVCPTLGGDLEESLAALKERLSPGCNSETISQTSTEVAGTVIDWGGRASAYYKKKTAEAKEIMVTLAQTAEIIAERDSRYSGQFGDLTGRLRTIANLDDLSLMRQQILVNATKLSTCVEQLTKESQDSVTRLRSELSSFQNRLEEAERLASQDPLTGLSNRRYTETQIEARIAKATPFCVLMLDLNGFKDVNDRYGHLVGDELLRQFAARLRSALRATDLIGRWGGDEFVVVLDCDAIQAGPRVVTIHKLLTGGYPVTTDAGSALVDLAPSIGVASWLPGDTMMELFKRADEAMYEQKRDARRTAGPNSGR